LRRVALFFSIGYRGAALAPALTVVTSMTHRLVVEWLPEPTTEAHWLDVIYYLCHLATLYAQRMLGEEGTPILTPLSGVVPWLLVSPLVHLLARLWVRHVWH